MVTDPDPDVRRLVAVQFHDICKMLGKERCAQYMKRCLPLFVNFSKGLAMHARRNCHNTNMY